MTKEAYEALSLEEKCKVICETISNDSYWNTAYYDASTGVLSFSFAEADDDSLKHFHIESEADLEPVYATICGNKETFYENALDWDM